MMDDLDKVTEKFYYDRKEKRSTREGRNEMKERRAEAWKEARKKQNNRNRGY